MKSKKNVLLSLCCLSLSACASSQYGGVPQGYNASGMVSSVAPSIIQAGLSAISSSGNGLPSGMSSAISGLSNQLLGRSMYSPSPNYQRASYNQSGYPQQNQGSYYPSENYPQSQQPRQYRSYRPAVPQYFGY